jgi:Preprotein translocase subunit SecA (ATPase, RNA helicase)
MSMAQGARLAFDQKTHKQVRQLFTRLSYIYYGGELLRRFDTPALQEKVLAHLQQARQALFDSIREAEASRLGLPVTSPQVTEAAERLQNQVYRQVLLGAITELWVDYLTHVEALRVSVGLEAYAQRDPLVQYKSQASEMFQTLLADIRSTVISRIFLIRPRTAAVNVEVAEPSPVETSGGAKVGPEAQKDTRDAAKKRKRHRH